MSSKYETTHPVEHEKLRHAARSLTNMLDIEQTNDALTSVAEFLEDNLIDSRGSNPEELCDMMMTQARLLDAGFHYMLAKYPKTMCGLQDAVQIQKQMVRTALAWKKMRTRNEVVRRFIDIEKNPRETD